MKKKIFYRISIGVLCVAILVITYSLYKIIHSRNRVVENIRTWDSTQKTKNSTNYNGYEKIATDKNILPIKYKNKPNKSEVIGKMTIMRTEMVLPIIQGTTDTDLENGAGHYVESFLPGENGNCIIFGHRDGVFKSLEEVRLNDIIVVETSAGKVVYKIIDTKITSPEEGEIIKSYDNPTLTLVTCYPFNYIGDAPKRFIITAKLEVGEE